MTTNEELHEVHPPEEGEPEVQAPPTKPPKRVGGEQKKKLSPALDDAKPIPNAADKFAVPAHPMLRWEWFDERWHLTRTYGSRSWGDAVAALGTEYRLNLRGRSVEVRVAVVKHPTGVWTSEGLSGVLQQKVSGEWCAVSDIFERELRERHGEFFRFFLKGKAGIPDGYVSHSMNAPQWLDQRLLHLGSHQFDAMAEYLSGLPVWDGVDRLSPLLHDTVGAKEDDVVARWVMHGLLTGVIARTRRPGHPHDWMPVLVGDQGIGKSLLLQTLVLPGMHREFEMTSDHKLVIERSAGAVILEWAELKSARNTSLESLKDCLSRSKDVARLAYDRNTTEQQRMWVFAATANNPGRLGVLPPDDEHRRFLVVQCSDKGALKSGVVGFVEKIRDQLWAQALHECTTFKPNEGQRLVNLPPQDVRQAGHRASGSAIKVSHWIEGRSHLLKDAAVLGPTQSKDPGVNAWRATTIVERLHSRDSSGRERDVPALAPQAENYAVQQIADKLRQAGWVQKQTRQHNLGLSAIVRLWVAPFGWFDDDSWLDDEEQGE